MNIWKPLQQFPWKSTQTQIFYLAHEYKPIRRFQFGRSTDNHWCLEGLDTAEIFEFDEEALEKYTHFATEDDIHTAIKNGLDLNDCPDI